MLMLAPNNIFSPSSGKPVTTPTQDIALGCYYLTMESQRDRIRRRTRKRNGDDVEHLPILNDAAEVHTAYVERALAVHAEERLDERRHRGGVVGRIEQHRRLLRKPLDPRRQPGLPQTAADRRF